MGRREEALAAWWNATRQNFTHAMAWNNVIAVLDMMGTVITSISVVL